MDSELIHIISNNCTRSTSLFVTIHYTKYYAEQTLYVFLKQAFNSFLECPARMYGIQCRYNCSDGCVGNCDRIGGRCNGKLESTFTPLKGILCFLSMTKISNHFCFAICSRLIL